MNYQKPLVTLVLIASVVVTNTAQASLVDRGNGLLYDNVLNLTWLQDANYAKTSGYDTNGKMGWGGATAWAANLVYGGYSDWRLASNTPVNGSSFNYSYANNGSTDYGYNITSPHSELSYMYYVNLGLKGFVNSAGVYQPNFGIFGNGTYNGVDHSPNNQSSHSPNNVGLVTNLQSDGYWSGSDYAPDSTGNSAWYFFAGDGTQENGALKEDIHNQLYAWAVHPGDVAAVPVPGAIWLFGSGLLGLLGLKKRKAV